MLYEVITSTLTQYPGVAAISTFGVLLLFWLLDWSGKEDNLLAYLSLLNHYEPFLRGVFDVITSYSIHYTKLYELASTVKACCFYPSSKM